MFRESVDKRYKGAAVLDKSATCVRVGNIAHLLIGNVQEFQEFPAIGSSLIEHNHKFRVGEHCACLYGIEQILHILRNSGRVAVSLSELPPRRVKEDTALLVFKYNMKFVDKDMSSLAFLPVERNTVQNGIGNNQKLCNL